MSNVDEKIKNLWAAKHNAFTRQRNISFDVNQSLTRKQPMQFCGRTFWKSKKFAGNCDFGDEEDLFGRDIFLC